MNGSRESLTCEDVPIVNPIILTDPKEKPITKFCPKCKRKLPKSEFQNDKSTPSGLCCWCRGCHSIHQAKGRAANYEEALAREAIYRAKRKPKHKAWEKARRLRCIEHYGGKCACCGESRYEFLAIDHINGDGNEHRKKIGNGSCIVGWLIKNNFPEGFRILCHNCNASFGLYGYCPHQKERENESSL